MAAMELLLLSNSTNYGGTMFSHAAEAFADVAAGDIVTFVPYALADWDYYAERVADALGALDIEVVSAHRSSTPDKAILEAQVLLMGGGNTFRLLDSLYALDVVGELSLRVREGATRYVGASAGTNVACPTIRTTNDMAVVEPPSTQALGLVPFQINPHYLDAEASSTHMGETREARLLEYLEENAAPVLGLREGSALSLQGRQLRLIGSRGARLFRRGLEPAEFSPGSDLSFLLES